MPDVVSHLRSAGFNDDEISSWANDTRTRLKGAGFSDGEVDDYFGQPKTPAQVPEALVDRMLKATDFSDRIKGLPQAVTDIPHEALQSTIESVKGIADKLLPKSLGGGREPATEGAVENITKTGAGLLDVAALPFAPLQGTLRAFVGHPMVATDAALRAGAVALFGEDKVARTEKERGMTEGGMTYEEAKGRVDTALMAAGSRNVVRFGMGPGGIPEMTQVGGLPKGQDFSDASTVLGHGDTTPLMEQKLGDLYEQKGVHPAEVAHDANSDVTITQSIVSSDKADVPKAYGATTQDVQSISWDRTTVGEGLLIKGGSLKVIDVPTQSLDDAFRASHKAFAVETPSDAVVQHAASGQPMSIPQVSISDKSGRIDFVDGRNRAALARDLGEKTIPIAVDAVDADKIRAALNAPEDILTEGVPQSGGAAATPRVPYTDAEKQVLSKISIDEKAPESKLTFDKLYTDYLDKLYPLSKAVKEAGGAELAAEDNPYQLGRLLSGYVGKADHFLNEATFDYNTYEANGPSLKSILNPVKGDLNGFRAYATAARAIELEDRGIKSGFAEEGGGAPPLMSTGLDAARTVVAEGRDKFEQPFRDLIAYQNRVTAYLRDSGVLSKAGYEAMVEANKMYVPFTRVMGIDENAPHGGGSTLQAQNPIKAIKGSARSIVDPVESVVRNTYHMIEMAEKNTVGTKLDEMLSRASAELPEAPAAIHDVAATDTPRTRAIADELGSVGIKNADELASALAHASEDRKPGEFAFFKDGQRVTRKVDPELARAMKGLDVQSASILEKLIAFPASTLRAGSVLTPDFALRHTIRDFLYAATTFKDGVFNPMDMARGFSGLIMKDADYWNWMKGGGGNISMVGMDRQYLQADLRKLTDQAGLMTRTWNLLSSPDASMWDKTKTVGAVPFRAVDQYVLDPLRAATQFAENASHLGAFKKTMRASERAEPEATNLRQQIIQAAWASRDTAVDAARMGANMRAYNMITAFANIKLQDTDRVVRAIKDDPLGSLTKIGGAITVPSVLLWAANHNDPRYAEIPQWEKDMFWLVMTPDHVFRIPKPWAMGMVFGSLPERLLDAFVAHKPEAFKDYLHQLWETSGPDFVPTAAAPVIDQFANRSTFTNRTLIPSSQEKFLPEYQYTPYTTELTKSLGQIIGAFPGMTQLKMDNSGFGGVARALTSPILMENYVRGWTGTLGTYALQAADKGLRMAGKLPDPPQPAATLADIPIIRAFVVRYPSASAESIQHFYDEYAKNKAYFDTWNAMAKDGNFAAMQHIQAMGGDAMSGPLDSVHNVLTMHNQWIRDIYKNPDIPPGEKRQLIDTAYGNMIMMSRQGLGMIKQMREQAADVVSGGPTVH